VSKLNNTFGEISKAITAYNLRVWHGRRRLPTIETWGDQPSNRYQNQWKFQIALRFFEVIQTVGLILQITGLVLSSAVYFRCLIKVDLADSLSPKNFTGSLFYDLVQRVHGLLSGPCGLGSSIRSNSNWVQARERSCSKIYTGFLLCVLFLVAL
jgi:hypothetical protein